MKPRLRPAVVALAVLLGVLLALGACATAPPSAPRSSLKLADGTAAPSLVEVANQVAVALRARDLVALAGHVHPQKGVRFSPYPYVDPEHDVTLLPAELVVAAGSDTPRRWGHHDGSGEPIELSFADYLDRFVYDAPYLEEATITVDELQPVGNAVDNLRQIYPAARVVEYYLPGRDPRYGGMDWRSLRLVFEPGEEGRRWLVGVVHGEWTI